MFRRGMVAAVVATLVIATSGCSSDGGAGAVAPGGVSDISEVRDATIYVSAFGVEERPEGTSSTPWSGSGFFIDENGLAMTNYHVVAGAVTLEAYIGGDTDRAYPVTVVGASQCNDLALVQVHLNAGEKVPFLSWHEGEPTVGLPIYAAGYPLGDTEFTLTGGIVSKARADGEQSWASIDYTIEIDASIQPGNSGGPVVDEQGRVVGVVYSKATPGTGQNQFFAIGAPLAEVAADAMKDGDYESFGVWGDPFLTDDGTYLGLWVSAVEAGSIADEAGIRAGDIIAALNGVDAVTDGTLSTYCDVIRTSGSDPISATILRLSTGEILEGDLGGAGGLVVVETFDPADGGGIDMGGDDGTPDDYEQYVSVIDDTGLVSVDIPAAWTDMSTAPTEERLGAEFFGVMASPDNDAFSAQFSTGDFDTPGIQLLSIVPPIETLGDVKEDGYGTRWCTLDYSNPGPFTFGYDEREYVGEFVVFSECGGTSAQYFLLMANPSDGGYHTLYLAAVMILPRDEQAVNTALGTLSISGAG